ncbi:hypothetical protein, partial [Serratia sp. ME43]|uniref:hypothetical protein n=1 Tax=Serratia sp. ME43 TaxID=2744256 RepID=UPI001C71036A
GRPKITANMQRSLIGFSKNCSLPQRHPVTEKVITCVRWRLLYNALRGGAQPRGTVLFIGKIGAKMR